MFCPNCGKENPDGNKICYNCQARLVDNSGDLGSITSFDTDKLKDDLGKVKDKAKTATEFVGQKLNSVDTAKAKSAFEKIKSNKMAMVGICAAAALVVVFVALAIVGKAVTDPKKIAEDYFKCLKNKDYAGMYSYLEIEESDYINEEMYVKFMQQNDSEIGNVVNYNILDEKDYYKGNYGGEYYDYDSDYDSDYDYNDEQSLTKNYYVEYVTQGSSSTNEYVIRLIKLKSKKFLFFDNYRVASFVTVADNVTVCSPAGTKAYVDGVELTNPDKATEETDWLDVYTIPQMFAGAHSFTTSSDYYEDTVLETYVESDREVYIEAELSYETQKSLWETSDSIIKALLSGAAIEKPFSELGIKDITGNMKDDYNSLVNNFGESVTGCRVDSIDRYDDIQYDNGVAEFESYVEYQYSYDYGNGQTGSSNYSLYIDIDFVYDSDSGKFVPIAFDY